MDRIAYKGITFDDVLLEPGYSDIVPRDVDVRTRLTRKIRLHLPILSSPMDTVTESDLAIALAQEGGMGIIHKNMSVADQTREVDKVKRSENGIIFDPITLPPDDTVGKARKIMEENKVSGVPITTEGGILKGILTRRDLKFLEDNSQLISEVMTKDNLVTAAESTTLEDAERILTRNKVEKLLLVDDQYRLKGLITIKDIDMMKRFPNACKDRQGRLRVGAAVGVFDYDRAASLIAKGVDMLVVDSAHGHSSNVIETVTALKKRWGIEVVAGNVATREGCRDLINAGADGVKVGIGPGSICTTRIVAGVGVPQITAISNVYEALKDTDVPLIADGGIRYSGDVAKAIAAGADTVMMGGAFAGTEEAPGETILYQGRTFKSYRGMGSMGAMAKGSADRYFQAETGNNPNTSKLVPEGIEGQVPYKGSVVQVIFQMAGGLKASMHYCGCASIADMQNKAEFVEITTAGMRESHVHDVQITKEAPNYRSE